MRQKYSGTGGVLVLTFPIFAVEVESLKEECFLSRRLLLQRDVLCCMECRKSLIFTYERK
jgi:hypothetical protein